MNEPDLPVAAQREGRLARWGRPAAFAAAGLVAGGLLAGTLSANAAGSGTSTQGPGGYAIPGQQLDGGSHGQRRPDEQVLTGTTAAKVKAAAVAEYPGASVVRVEADGDGVYEAHLTKADGTEVIVGVDKSFTVTGTEPAGHRGCGSDGPTGATGSADAA